MIEQLKSLKNNLENLESLDINEINLKRTHLFIVDLNNGFAKSGNLYSDRVNALIKPTVEFLNLIHNDISKITAFTDCHDENSLEFLNYPSHCLKNDYESEIVDELKEFKNIEVLKKNSTNSFFALKDTSFNGIDNIIIIGDCTDICIYQFVVTLKAYFNQNNIKKEIIVPINLIDTYDIPNIHSAEIFNTVFINSMIQNGIKVVSKIKNG